jgi:hypothetical protein
MAACAYFEAETELYESGLPICLKCSEEHDNKVGKKPPVSSKSVQNILVSEVVEATSRTNRASQAFLEVMGQIPTGFPHPDGSQRIHDASRHLAAARKDLMRAHTRLDDFVKTGIVPDDLKRSG